MSGDYPLATRPLTLKNGLTLKNRLFFASMGVDLADESGRVTPALIDFYRGILSGGCGLAFLGNTTVSAESRLQARGLGLFEQGQQASLKPLLQMAAQLEVPLGVQLQHYGGQGVLTDSDQALLTPSAIPCARTASLYPDYRVQAMTEVQIAQVVDDFGNCAWRAWSAGARIVQLQASNGYLLSSFLSPRFNQRTDHYGGNEENRSRLLLQIIRAIRLRTSDSLAITVRLGIDDLLGDQGLQFTELGETVQALCNSGISALECSFGVGESFGRLLTYSQDIDDYLQCAVKTIKASATVPVGYAGFIASLDKAERLLADGVCDLAGMSRALFADNALIAKTLQGRSNEINRCLWDGKCFGDKSNPHLSRVHCCVNPAYLRPSFN
ncbi:NADH:flavin oxidoreductase [Pseudomonas sp. RC10]|uniref:NADH:flavin oxidoreductase n=1 Tax=Pseudomonas bambusae TaxID=3139142 RepID=UPI003139B7E2